MDNEMLSLTAKESIVKMKNRYILTPEQFKRFLFKDAYGKPRPNILPIARSFTGDINGLIHQLRSFQSSLKDAHRKYMAERKKDMKLEIIISKLVANIRKEVRSEKNEGRVQMSLCQYVRTGKYTTRNSFRLTSKAVEIIKGMTEDTLNPVEFKGFLLEVALERHASTLLPILRSFTTDVSGVIKQLVHLKKFLHEDHRKYMDEHEKDNNVCDRIKRLIGNIEKEEQFELRQGIRQMHI